MVQPLQTDATLRNLRLPPKEAAALIRKIIAVMRAEMREHGELVLRMGIKGTGVAPNYRFDRPNGDAVVAVDGATHKRWPPSERFDQSQNWSAATMTYLDIEGQLASLTGYPGSGAVA